MVEHIFIIAFISYGWCACFWEEHIFEKVGDWLYDRLPEFITKPLYDCPICNSFWMGTAIYWTMWGHDWKEWAMISMGAVGLCAAIVNIINKIEDIGDGGK